MDQTTSLSTTDRVMGGIGLVAGAIPFFITMSSSSSVTVDGVVTSATYRDNLALGCGGAAVFFGLLCAVLAAKNGAGSTRIVTGVAVLGLGVYAILCKGLGLVPSVI
ncbi:MAG TPA: hypothetical protein VGM90_22630 [Kofleriaceae bacterium]|jgi:hypothetical protein